MIVPMSQYQRHWYRYYRTKMIVVNWKCLLAQLLLPDVHLKAVVWLETIGNNIKNKLRKLYNICMVKRLWKNYPDNSKQNYIAISQNIIALESSLSAWRIIHEINSILLLSQLGMWQFHSNSWKGNWCFGSSSFERIVFSVFMVGTRIDYPFYWKEDRTPSYFVWVRSHWLIQWNAGMCPQIFAN